MFIFAGIPSVQTLVNGKLTFTCIWDLLLAYLKKQSKLQSSVNWVGKSFCSVSNPNFGQNPSSFFLLEKHQPLSMNGKHKYEDFDSDLHHEKSSHTDVSFKDVNDLLLDLS